MNRAEKVITIIFILFLSISCKTPPPSSAATPLLEVLALPLALPMIFDKPGPYGNWWQKTPLDWEKESFERALKGPLSPKEKLAKGDFVGWFGVLLDCANSYDGFFRLTLEHRHAGANNIMFGVRDSQAIHTVSLFGDGVFYVDYKKPCKDSVLPGDLFRVYGKVKSTSKNVITVSALHSRVWPRATYEITPDDVYRAKNSSTILRDSAGWPKLKMNKAHKSRSSEHDYIIYKALKVKLKSDDKMIRARAAYTIGEMGNSKFTTSLNEAFLSEKDERIKKAFEFAIKRSERAIGPFWKPTAKSPYWL